MCHIYMSAKLEKTRLNPLGFGAGLCARNSKMRMKPLRVLIPWVSGLGYVPFHALFCVHQGVLIPWVSGLGYVPSYMYNYLNFIRLNPLGFGAGLCAKIF